MSCGRGTRGQLHTSDNGNAQGNPLYIHDLSTGENNAREMQGDDPMVLNDPWGGCRFPSYAAASESACSSLWSSWQKSLNKCEAGEFVKEMAIAKAVGEIDIAEKHEAASPPVNAADLGPIENMGRVAASIVEAPPSASKDTSTENSTEFASIEKKPAVESDSTADDVLSKINARAFAKVFAQKVREGIEAQLEGTS